ncbi:spore cortex biosynthesis protein YabQ [Priestia koreensis]|uniref:Spore cortex biosynthesis protein YabQ n=1 Tax=Priestia koreensis TaxID=284581 RepID=A0A0M0KU26_9BACI|nr:spore cortex biosynthesis protein YabQ [Priestia koreensis]KOO42335.1 hypothetical protein AMD01_18355 [Priestia koreensis]
MSLNLQFYTMIAMISMGSYLGAALDTYHYFFNRSKRSSWLVFINDLLFWFLQSLLVFYVLFTVNEGELRFYAFLALICGFAMYQALLKGMYMRVLVFLVQTIVRIYKVLVRTIKLLFVSPIFFLVKMVLAVLLGGIQILLKLALFLLKIIFAPFKWISFLIWRMLPKSVKDFSVKTATKIKGFLPRLQNMKQQLLTWWEKFRNKEE